MASYGVIHDALKRQKGKAVNHLCVCGKKACDWAYQRGCLDEKVDPSNRRAYCEHLDHYLPMCRSCHLYLDNDLRDTRGNTEEARTRHLDAMKRGGLEHRRRMAEDPEYAARTVQTLRGIGREVSTRRRRCDECPIESNPAGIARHHGASGHRGYTELEKEKS